MIVYALLQIDASFKEQPCFRGHPVTLGKLPRIGNLSRAALTWTDLNGSIGTNLPQRQWYHAPQCVQGSGY